MDYMDRMVRMKRIRMLEKMNKCPEISRKLGLKDRSYIRNRTKKVQEETELWKSF